MKDKQAKTVANAFLDYVCRYGCPENVVSDRGSEFTCNLFKEISSQLSFNLRYTTAFHPQSNGLTESFNKLLKNTLITLVQDDVRSWNAQLPCAVLALNMSYHPSIRNTPYYLFHGRAPPLQYSKLLKNNVINYSLEDDSPACVYGRLQKAFKDAFDSSKIATELNVKYRKATAKPLAVTDTVFLRNDAAKRGPYSKFKLCWLGPYTITKKLNDVNYEIKPIASRGPAQVVHINRLKAAKISKDNPFLGINNNSDMESENEPQTDVNIVDNEMSDSDEEESIIINLPTTKNKPKKNAHGYALRSMGPVASVLHNYVSPSILTMTLLIFVWLLLFT